MRVIGLLLIVVLFIGISACGEKSQEVKDIENAIDMVKNAPNIVKKVESAQEKAKKVWEERKAKGDTLPYGFRELQKYLPDNLPGYTAKEPRGETMNMMGFSYSEASRQYIKKSEDGSKQAISIKILDYNSTASLFTAAASWWATGYSFENEDGYAKSFDPGIENCYGYEEYHAKRKNAEITLAIAYRFILTINASNQSDTEGLKNIVKQIALEKLAKL